MPRIATLIAALPLLVGCSKTLDPQLYPSAESLFEASMEAYRAGDCGLARQGFQRLVFELPGQDERQASVRYYLGECMLQGNERTSIRATHWRRMACSGPAMPMRNCGTMPSSIRRRARRLWRPMVSSSGATRRVRPRDARASGSPA